MSPEARLWMAISGVTGFTLFLLANFYLKKVKRLRVITALAQVCVNLFVHLTWWRGFTEAQPGLGQVVAGIGATIPLIMATITMVRVLIPSLRQWIATRRP